MVTREFIDAVKLMMKHRPEWTKPFRFMMIAGRECFVEYNPASGTLKFTIKRCTMCGECCMGLAPKSDVDIHWGTDAEGKCNMLRKEGSKWACDAGNRTPIMCFPDVRLNCPQCEMIYITEEGVLF